MYALAEHFMPRCQDGQGYSEDKILACDRPNIFSRIHEKTLEMVIWDRQLPKMMRNWLSTRTWTGLPSGRVLIKPNESEDALSSMLSPLGGSLCKGAELFMADAAQLVNTFSELTNSDLVDVRVDAIRHDACWRFHRDCVPLRLITTYLGPGTEFVDPADSERAFLEQKTFAGKIHRVPPFAVCLFKGSRNADGAGVVHRSPPVAGTGQQRLVLCLNTPSITSPPR